MSRFKHWPNVLPEKVEQPFGAFKCVEVPEISNLPASPYDFCAVCSTTISGREIIFLFFEYIREILIRLLESLKLITFKLIYRAVSDPIRRSQHLNRKRACPLEIDDIFDVPIAVDKDVASMQVREVEHK